MNVLNDNISEENKQFIISICRILLKRSMDVTAMVLSRQTAAMGNLALRLRKDKNNLVGANARAFIASAFVSFGSNGLFVLLFKVGK